ncbi:hypothetical protein TKK_0000113 [Trichogramma kaykai]|uniref:Retrotransposon gag domain-containing protein n=1 Tax=Trichogramma kaykai TaxID=54128 RepID=A0ABD2W1B5_9HYME
MAVSWVCRLNKSELTNIMADAKLDTEGTVTDLRQRMVAFVRQNPKLLKDKKDPPDYDEKIDITHDFSQEVLDLKTELQLEKKKHDEYNEKVAAICESLEATDRMRAELEQKLQETERIRAQLLTAQSKIRNREDRESNISFETSTPTRREPKIDSKREMLDQIGKWNCHFDGKDVYTFLDRVEEPRMEYGFLKTDLLYGIPKILRGNALEWYRNFATNCRDWDAFVNKLRDFYLSPEEKCNLDRQITERVQGQSESIKENVNALATLMRRRGGIPPSEQLDNIYYDMKAELQIYIKDHKSIQ